MFICKYRMQQLNASVRVCARNAPASASPRYTQRLHRSSPATHPASRSPRCASPSPAVRMPVCGLDDSLARCFRPQAMPTAHAAPRPRPCPRSRAGSPRTSAATTSARSSAGAVPALPYLCPYPTRWWIWSSARAHSRSQRVPQAAWRLEPVPWPAPEFQVRAKIGPAAVTADRRPPG